MIEKVTNNDVYSDKFSDRRLKEKEKFDNKHSRTLKPFTLNTTVSHLNADLKTWSVGSVVSRSPDNRSYHIKTENGQIISHNRVHLCETNVEFIPQVQNIAKVSKILGVNQFQTQISPQSQKQSLQINVALLVPMLVLIIIVTKQDLATKSENHLGISKS